MSYLQQIADRLDIDRELGQITITAANLTRVLHQFYADGVRKRILGGQIYFLL